ncbi:MAG: ABC transporter ATP-binding protein, partial [Spirochaetota bacterium]|nr:ABC transporter ATP-binding protein [Spirochaetota bacterium]
GKKYLIGHKKQIHNTFRDLITDSSKEFVKKVTNKSYRRKDKLRILEDFWALRNISFSIKEGERVGIIGRNGAGKSTLLKILSQITDPTEGKARIVGRVGSLLEVGTGFHTELTGRENVYLNGAILGMTKSEVDRKFDEIVDFSEVRKFLDTPVKRYSSGMRVRLGFAVAAHLEPEILMVDEVLAVGDVQFRRKCLGKMHDISKKGRTILFVSHNLAAVQSLCTRTILLHQGRLIFDGAVDKALDLYLQTVQQTLEELSLEERKDRKGGKSFRFSKVEFLNSNTMEPIDTILSGRDVKIKINYICKSKKPLEGVELEISFYTTAGNFLFSSNSKAIKKTFDIYPGEGYKICHMPKWPLISGRHYYHLIARHNKKNLDIIEEAGYIDVMIGDYYNTGSLPNEKKQGVFIDYDWL